MAVKKQKTSHVTPFSAPTPPRAGSPPSGSDGDSDSDNDERSSASSYHSDAASDDDRDLMRRVPDELLVDSDDDADAVVSLAPRPVTTLPSRIQQPSRVVAATSRVKASRVATIKAVPSTASSSDPSLSKTTTITDNASLEASTSTPLPSTASTSPVTFSSLGVSNALIAGMGNMSIRKPTSIQQGCIPAILAGRDCIGLAQTGSGKTLAFALPILQRIARDPFGIWAVVLTPTRELAFQLAEQFHVLGVPMNLKTSVVVGGMDIITQAQEMCARPHVVVATPGRLVDLLRSSSGEWGLDKVQTLVLDEADRMLTPTFASDLAYLMSRIPTERQTCLFTATESDAIRQLEAKEPRPGKEKIFVHKVLSDTSTVSTLKQHYLFIPSHIREPYLYYLLLNPPKSIAHFQRLNPNVPASSSTLSSKSKPGKNGKRSAPTDDDELPHWPPSTIIFTSRCATAAHLHALLQELGIPSVPLHSYLSQPERLRSLATFRANQAPVLIATDVGSRGLDIPEVAMVINWDCPRFGADYIHRVGRTARAGRGGVAVTMVTERDTELVAGIEETINATLTELELPEEKVLEDLNKVSTAKRVAAMALHDSGFGEKQKTRAVLESKRRKRDAARKQ